MTRTSTRLFSICIAIASAALVPVLLASDAEAGKRGRGGGEIYEKDFHVPRGTKGYSGFVPGGAYCDYIRRPKRVCYETRNGKRKCRMDGWILTQTCYQ